MAYLALRRLTLSTDAWMAYWGGVRLFRQLFRDYRLANYLTNKRCQESELSNYLEARAFRDLFLHASVFGRSKAMSQPSLITDTVSDDK
jgi:hypothetical protein